MVRSISQRGTDQMLFLLMRFLPQKFSRLSKVVIFYFFFLFRLYDDAHFQYFKGIEISLFCKRSDSFLIWHFYSFRSLFSLFIVSMARFPKPNSIPISWLYILIVCISLEFFSFFANILMSSKYIRLLNFCCD